ncbi:DUF1707 SHOCT-like domain-containing protein [Actinomadura latina]|uniref:DUF1707 domain-containing protein n=1 Tax=Actinomadura latina TaxID=163603 RepID=A0A846Z978_9ACTN|nr:DUF1707 domain-containing protein [Actinomadura latina]NKZ08307.1 DUF1707 domain-containing protein [Actinomadura latina]
MDSARSPEPAPEENPGQQAISGDPELRASDSDRERAAAVLQAATADGRVSTEELEERLDLVYRAKSKGELTSIVKDLQPIQWAGGASATTKDVSVINDFSRTGRWVVGAEYRATAIIGSGVIDLREAQFTGPETTIHVNSWISTVYVVVPEHTEVHVAGTGIIGGFKRDPERPDDSATHRVNVTGVAVCGSVFVVHDLPPAKQRRLLKKERKSLGR